MTVSTEQIWTQLSGELRQFIGRRVGNDALADDLLQETFVRIHNGIGRLRDQDRMLPWVYRIARSTIADHFRRQAARAVDRAEAEASQNEAPDNYNAEVHRWLARMIGELPPTYRAAMELNERGDLTQQEIAAQLDLSVSGAKSRIQRGREMLKDMLLQCCHLDFDRFGNVVDYGRRNACGGCCGTGDGCDPGAGTEALP